MDGLRTTRVVIVDDEREDAIAILLAISRLGIGAAYYSGDPDQLPEERLRGVRLIVLDMDLGTGASEPAAILGPTLAVVDRLLDVGNGPVLVVAWTGYGDLVDEFRQRLQTARPDLHPLFIILVEKVSVKIEGRYDVVALSRLVIERTRALFPFDLLLRWEEQTHLAAGDAVRSITDLIGPATGGDAPAIERGWRDGLLEILRALARAAAGGDIADGEAARRALFEALNPLHVDCLEQRCLAGLGELDERANALRGESTFNKDKPQSAALNGRLLVAALADAERRACPGNLYLASSWPNTGATFPLSRVGISLEIMINDALNQAKDVAAQCELVMVELTPACDFVQGKAQMLRLVGGLLLPASLEKQVKAHTAFLWISPQLDVPGRNQQYLVLNAHFTMGLEKGALPVKADFRIRRQALVDIQAWFASHGARPGYMRL